MTPLHLLAATAIAALTGGAALAQSCPATGDPYDLDADAVNALYACIEAKMATQYASKGNAVAAAYRGWTAASTRPAVAGPHGERFLQTFVNDIGAAQYLKYAEDGFTMPVGTVIAKESFRIKKGEAVVGPLFIMTKLENGAAPDAQDWHYDALLPSGGVMKIKQSFCANCHMGWEDQDSLAYPLEEVRIAR